MVVYQEQYRRGSQGQKSTEREKLVNQAAEVGNCAGRVLSFLVALCRQGFDGTLSPLDVISERLKKATGGKGEPRTIRRCLITLEQLGFIHRAYHRTGNQLMTPKGLLNLQILRVTFTPVLYQLLGFQSIPKHRPKRPLHPKTEPREKETIGRFPFPDGLTIGEPSQKGNRMDDEQQGVQIDGVQLAPAFAVAHTLLGHMQSAAMKDESVQILDQIYQDEETPEKRVLKAVPPEERYKAKPPSIGPTEKEKAYLGSSVEFLAALFQAVSDCTFSKKYFKTFDNTVQNTILTICQNQNSPFYPKSFPKVPFDLIAWSMMPWPHQTKCIEAYVESIKKFENDLSNADKVTALFHDLELPHVFSYAKNIACLMVMGKMKIGDLPDKYLKDFPA
jgi:hypothetical protein